MWLSGRCCAPQVWDRKIEHTASAIEEPVSGLDSIVDGVGASVVVNLPQTKADLRHLVAIVQRNVGGVDSHCRECVAMGIRGAECGRGCSGYASSDRSEESAFGSRDRSEGAHSINTRTAETPGKHVPKVFFQVTINFPGVCRLYTPPRRLDRYDPASSTGRRCW